MLRGEMLATLDEVRSLEARIAQLERELTAMVRAMPACQLLMTIPGVGLLTATALVAARAQAAHSRCRIYDCRRSLKPTTSIRLLRLRGSPYTTC
jgi:transposase